MNWKSLWPIEQVPGQSEIYTPRTKRTRKDNYFGKIMKSWAVVQGQSIS